MLKIIIAAAFVLMPSLALAAGPPTAECTLNASKSSVLVIASNPGDTAYTCFASCRANMSAARALDRVECSFNLGKNAAEKAVCTKDGGTPKFYSAVSPTRVTCVPK